MALAPERPESHFNLGLAYRQRGMFAVAQEQLQASLQLDPGSPTPATLMGLIYAEELRFLTRSSNMEWSCSCRTRF